MYHRRDFPCLPSYNAFLNHCHRVTPHLVALLQHFLADTASVHILDATMLPVCKPHRVNSHKTAKNVADFGKNHQGWHYGFKLHVSVNIQGQFCGLALTPANIHDAQMMPVILNKHTKVAVGDTLYGARVMRERMWKEYGTIVVAPPHPKQKKKVMTGWQFLLLRAWSKIESVFDYLKEHPNLVTSFPRSVHGYLVHYLRILLSYQILVQE